MSLNQNFPIGNAPIVDPSTGIPTLTFFAWMRSIFERTGGAPGISSEDLELLSILGQPPQPADLSQAFLFSAALAQQPTFQPFAGYVLPASEAIDAGDLLNIYVDAGVMTQRKADGSDPAKFCNAFSPGAVGDGLTGPVQFAGFNDKVTVSTGAMEVWLSDVTPGAFTTTAPTTAGHLLQTVGTAVLGLGLAFAQGTYTIL